MSKGPGDLRTSTRFPAAAAVDSMAWQEIEGHDAVVERFRRALARGRLASTFLFVGPKGIGKRRFAERLARALLCPNLDASSLAPCGRCDSCVQAAAGTHPDLMIVEKPPEKSVIPVESLVGDREHRMREGLCHDIALKPFFGGRKVAIVDDADHLNEEGANALLKTLEEPPPRSVLILIGTSAERQLPTIRSRCQVVRFDPLDAAGVCRILESQGFVAEVDQARRLSGLSGGSVARALELADDDLWQFRDRLLEALAAGEPASVSLSETTCSFIDAAGKEAPLRRARARQVIGFAADFYRQLLRALVGAPARGDAALQQTVDRAASSWPGDAETATACIDRTLAALGHVDRNAHQRALVECWLDDLSRIVQSGQPLASQET